MFWYYFQKQPFVDVLKNRCSYSFAPVVELLFHKVVKSDSTSATSNERILQRVTSDFLQQAISATSNEQILQRATSATTNEWILKRVTSDFLQRTTSATSSEQILQRVTSEFQRVMSNEWKVTPLYIAKLKVTSSWYRTKSEATTGVKNTASYIPWLYATWDQMVAPNMILCILVLMTTFITQAFCIKFKQCLFIILKLIPTYNKKTNLLLWQFWRTVQKLQKTFWIYVPTSMILV